MKNYMCIFLLCLVLFTVGCSKSNEAEAENIDVYASEIYFEKSDFNLVVGEKIEIDTLGLAIKPQNATVLPKFWVDDIDIANIIRTRTPNAFHIFKSPICCKRFSNRDSVICYLICAVHTVTRHSFSA